MSLPHLTSNGNPRGTITNPQIGAIYLLVNQAKHNIDDVNDRCVKRFGHRISGLSKEQASIIIDAYKNL